MTKPAQVKSILERKTGSHSGIHRVQTSRYCPQCGQQTLWQKVEKVGATIHNQGIHTCSYCKQDFYITECTDHTVDDYPGLVSKLGKSTSVVNQCANRRCVQNLEGFCSVHREYTPHCSAYIKPPNKVPDFVGDEVGTEPKLPELNPEDILL
jgi:hypothetical protein